MKAPTVDHAALVEVLEVLHESAIEPDGWAPVLRALARHLRADLSTLHSYDHATGGGHLEPGIGIDASQARRYTEHYSAINAWKVRRRNPGRVREVLLGSEVIGDAEFSLTPPSPRPPPSVLRAAQGCPVLVVEIAHRREAYRSRPRGESHGVGSLPSESRTNPVPRRSRPLPERKGGRVPQP